MATKTVLFTVENLRPPSLNHRQNDPDLVMAYFAFLVLVGFPQEFLSPSGDKMTLNLFGPDLWRQDGAQKTSIPTTPRALPTSHRDGLAGPRALA